jgi:HK97 family phage major capsid protein
MNKFKKFVKTLLERGYATEAEKEKAAGLFKALDEDDRDEVATDAETVADLPESAEEAEEAAEEDEEIDDENVEKGIKALFSREGKRIEKSLETKLDGYMADMKEAMASKAGVYHPDVQAKRKELNSTLRKTVSALISNDTAALKEMTTDDSGSPYAGYTVDSELSAEIRHLITEYGVARREMENVQLTKGSYKVNDLVTDVTVYWVEEGAVVNSTQAVLGQETLTLKKLGAIVTMTSELLEDSEIDLISFMASRVAEGFAQAEDEAFFKGDGTSAYGDFTGLLEASDVNEVIMGSGDTGFNDMDADDLLDMQDATPQGALANGKYYYHRTIKSIVRKLKATDGTYIYQAPSQNGPATVWGSPEVLVEAMPAIGDSAAETSFVLFGDLRKACIFGYKGAIKAKRFDAGEVRNVADDANINLITTDREAVRWTQRVGYVRVIPQAVTKLTTAAP